jgi:hypothetical protein
MPIILAFVLAPAIFASLDSIIRAALVLRSRPARGPIRGEHPRHWLVVIPARAEGTRLRESMASIAAAASAHGRSDVTALLLLDGEDEDAAAEARAHGFAVRAKTPAGPTKAAALAWLAREEQALLESADAILIIDAGSRVSADFFDCFVWPEGADAVQTFLAGFGEGAGSAATLSEHFAQSREDRGREALGWNIRLRGTGTAFRPQTFAEIIPQLVTRIEDHEASLLLTAAGATIRLAPEDAVVFDEKPSDVTAAASQRARWILGRYELLGRRPGTFAAIAARKPGEGIAAFVEIFGRPLSLSVPLRLVAGVWAIRSGYTILGSVVAGSTAIDVASHLIAARGIPRGTASVAASWVLALIYAPRALTRWLRTDR